ncbi:conserved hypothetical protein [Methylobacterium sp. 4-46]|uniref:ATP-binding protein n=1 Tax=unclassified Methylobacterium TaxID=2615210 RepID=UPI000152CE3C|nr:MULTISPECIES: ATP-binding protein [Methylobacterium]ACA15998.1 conserved hypothetical protein [Methylobacterium sp. 4-46]WFT81712.1 ATP-binding protein [Methylobacterium nodulans]
MTDVADCTFPVELQNWAGNRSGGVRRLFDDASGRPGETVLRTNLLDRLGEWARTFSKRAPGAPRILLLVGGPGNGKTEAIESTIRWLDEGVGANGALVALLRNAFAPPDGIAPRLVCVDLDQVMACEGLGTLAIVQDASAVTGGETRTAAQLLRDELKRAVEAGRRETYLCCVNRGILDDALVEAIDSRDDDSQRLLEAIARAVSLFPDAPPCWPLKDFPEVAVWPMDVESLLLPTDAGGESPARALLNLALNEAKWPAAGSCAAGSGCPFCGSRQVLSRDREQGALLDLLRWYEVASGKRWSFRDLFSLVSYLLAGHRPGAKDARLDPCRWAASLVQADELARRKGKPSKDTSTAIFQLVSAQYQHALFHCWDRDAGASLLRDIRDLGLEDDNTAMGLHWFLVSRRGQYLPTTIGASLDGLVRTTDPALAAPETEVRVSQRTAYSYRELDIRFSRSVREGLDYVRRSQILMRVEVDLLERLAVLDSDLSQDAARRSRPATATRVQRLVRDFACRTVRRTLGARSGAVLDAAILSEFQKVTEYPGGNELYEVALEVERLLNSRQNFEISLTTTFGQPLPPTAQRATLVVPARPVRPLEEDAPDRPARPIAYLRVGSGKSGQPIALTFDLFKAVKELREGMSVASLPRTVLALLDTTRARLSGPIVRDPEILDRAGLRIGTDGVVVEERRHGFVARRESVAR